MSEIKNQTDDSSTIWDEPVAEANQATSKTSSESQAPEASSRAQVSSPPSPAVADIMESGLLLEEEKKASPKTTHRPENLVAIARFRWLLLLILSLASVGTWAVDSQFISHRPYSMITWCVFALTLILSLGTLKFLRLPTRSGLAAICWSGTFFIDSLYGPHPTILGNIPAVLPWAGLLLMISVWVLVAIWRKLGRYKVIDFVLALIVLYASVGILAKPLYDIAHGGALSLSFQALSASPEVITNHASWFLWPMTIMVFFVLPLAAFFALWDQVTAWRRKGGRHGGNFFMALALIGLMPYGLMTFEKAAEANQALVGEFRALNEVIGVEAAPGSLTVPSEAAAPEASAPSPEEAANTSEPVIEPNAAPEVPPLVPEAQETQDQSSVLESSSSEPATVLPEDSVKLDVEVPSEAPAEAAAPVAAEPAEVKTSTPVQTMDQNAIADLENSLNEAKIIFASSMASLKKAEVLLNESERSLMESINKMEEIEAKIKLLRSSSGEAKGFDENAGQRKEPMPKADSTSLRSTDTQVTPSSALTIE